MNFRLATAIGITLVASLGAPSLASPTATAEDPSQLLTEQMAHTYVQGVLRGLAEEQARGATSDNVTSPVPGAVSVSQDVVDDATSKIMTGWHALLSNPDFVSLIDAKGFSSFSMEFAADSTGLITAHYGVSWVTPSLGITEYWAMDLKTGQLTGPALASTPNFHYTSLSSQIWAGREFAGSPSISGYAYTDLDVPTVSEPPAAQQHPVDRAMGGWLGVSSAEGGLDGLLQEGFGMQTHVQNSQMTYSDGSTVPNYGWWLMCVPDSSHTGFGPQPFTSGDASSPGHKLHMFLRYDGGTYGANTWKAEMYDVTSGVDHAIFANMNNCAGSSSIPFAPYWTQTMAEAPTVGSLGAAQISQWASSGEPSGVVANSANFWDAVSCTSGGSCTYEKVPFSSNDYTMSQYPGNSNTGQTIFLSGTDYDLEVEWINSNFQCGYLGIDATNEAC